MYTLQDASLLKPHNDKTPFAYVLSFGDGQHYIGSANGIYRLRYYRSVARGSYPSMAKAKNPTLMNALLSLDCSVRLYWANTLDEARVKEKALYIEYVAEGKILKNCREFGHAGRWINQDPVTEAIRKDTVRSNCAKARARLNLSEEHIKRTSKLGKAQTSTFRTCAECGKVSTIPTMGMHQKRTGHRGFI